MAAISSPRLREIARRIVGEPGFNRASNESLRRALARWQELATPEERLRAAETLIVQWFLDEHAEFTREQERQPALPSADDDAKAVAGEVVDDDGHVAPVTQVKFRSESPGWQPPATEAPAPQTSRSQSSTGTPGTVAAADNLPGGQTLRGAHSSTAAGDQTPVPAKRRTFPVERSSARDRAPVQQESRKVASYQQMFPELGFRVQAASGAKPLAEFTPADIDFRITQLRQLRQQWRGENAADESYIDDRMALVAKRRVAIAERNRFISDARSEEQRLTAAKREVDGYDVHTIGELPAEALDACGFKRRVA